MSVRHGLFLALVVFCSKPVFSFQDSSAACDAYQTMPLGQLPPLMGYGSSPLAQQLQAEYVAYLAHLRSGGTPESYKSRFVADQIRSMLNDHEQMVNLRTATHGDQEIPQMVARLQAIFFKGDEGTQEKANFALLLSDLLQRGEIIFDFINMELGNEARFTEEAKVEVGLLIGNEFHKNPWDSEDSIFAKARKILSEELVMTNMARQVKGQPPIVLRNDVVSIDPKDRPFPPETYMSSLSSAFLSQIVLQEPMLHTINFGGAAKGYSFDQTPILMTPYNGLIDNETWTNLSPWPVFPMTADKDGPWENTPKTLPPVSGGHIRKIDPRLSIRNVLTTFVGTKRGAINALNDNWGWFTELYRAPDGKLHVESSSERRSRMSDLADGLERQIRSRYICSCRVIGTPVAGMKKGVADVWHQLAYFNQGTLKKPLNSPAHMAAALQQMPFRTKEVDQIAAKTYLLERLSHMTDDCRVVREESDENRQNKSLTQELANEALHTIKRPAERVKEEVVAGGQTEPVEQDNEKDGEKKKKKDDHHDVPELTPPWGQPPASRPTAGNDNEVDGIQVAASIGILGPALILQQESAMLERIAVALKQIDELGGKNLVVIGVGAAAAIKTARVINKGILIKYPNTNKIIELGIRRSLQVLEIVGAAIAGADMLAESSSVAMAEERLETARKTNAYEYHFTLDGLTADVKSGRAAKLAKKDRVLAYFYELLATSLYNETHS
jgi:hypothetical protein